MGAERVTDSFTERNKRKRVVVLPILIEAVEIPAFLKDKLYADFTSQKNTRVNFLSC